MDLSSRQILILDDEPHLLEWLKEYLEKDGFVVFMAVNISEAIDYLQSQKFRMLILDLNVPASGDYEKILREKGEVYERYRGLFVAHFARDAGYRDKQVVVYSVHDIEEVNLVAQRLGVIYVTKGRPRSFKLEIKDILAYDPTAQRNN